MIGIGVVVVSRIRDHFKRMFSERKSERILEEEVESLRKTDAGHVIHKDDSDLRLIRWLESRRLSFKTTGFGYLALAKTECDTVKVFLSVRGNRIKLLSPIAPSSSNLFKQLLLANAVMRGGGFGIYKRADGVQWFGTIRTMVYDTTSPTKLGLAFAETVRMTKAMRKRVARG